MIRLYSLIIPNPPFDQRMKYGVMINHCLTAWLTLDHFPIRVIILRPEFQEQDVDYNVKFADKVPMLAARCDVPVEAILITDTIWGDVRRFTHELGWANTEDGHRLWNWTFRDSDDVLERDRSDIHKYTYLVHMVDVCYFLDDHPRDLLKKRLCECPENREYCTVIKEGLPHIIRNVRFQYPPHEAKAALINGEGHI
jgi:hypothetical protein